MQAELPDLTAMEKLEAIFEAGGVHFRAANIQALGGQLPKALENLERVKTYVEGLIEMITEDSEQLSVTMKNRQFCKVVRTDSEGYTMEVLEVDTWRLIASGPAEQLIELAHKAGYQVHNIEHLFSTPIKPGVNIKRFCAASRLQ